MAVAMHQISPMAYLPLVLGVVCKLNVAALIGTLYPPHPAYNLSCGRGVEALLLAILGGHHALYGEDRVGPATNTLHVESDELLDRTPVMR